MNNIYFLRYNHNIKRLLFKHNCKLKLKENMSSSTCEDISIDFPFGKLSGKIWNKGQPKTPILAFHGWMDNCGTWDHLCPLLTNEHPIIALDMPGHGLSSWPPVGSGVYFTDNLLAIHRVIKFLDFKKVILMGHSMGGGASMLYTASFPDSIEKLIVIDLFKPLHVDPEDQPFKTAKSLDRILEEEARLKTLPPKYSYENMLQRLVLAVGGSLTEEAAKTMLIRGSKKHDDGTYSFTSSPLLKAPGILSMTFEQQKRFASEIKCDFLLIKGKDATLFQSAKVCKEILDVYKRSKNFTFEVIEGNHHLHLTNPKPVAIAVNNFLKNVPQSDQSKEFAENYVKSKIIEHVT